MQQDTAIVDAVAEDLRALPGRPFANVLVGAELDQQVRSSIQDTAAVVRLTECSDDSKWPGETVRTVRFEVTIVVREMDAEARQVQLAGLAGLVRRAIHGRSIADLTIPEYTRAEKRAGRHGKARPPDQTVVLQCEAAYLIDDEDDENPEEG